MDIEILEEAAPAAFKAPNPVMDMILEWIGFNQEATRACIREEGFETFADLATMKEKDIRDLAESYSRCTVADAGRAIFGLRRIRYMIGLIHWVQDLVESVRHQPWKAWTKLSHSGMLWTRPPISALMSERLRRTSPIPSARLPTPENSKMKGNGPNGSQPLPSNYLSTIPGVNGITLWYVIWENETPDRTMEYPIVNERAIACASLSGPNFQADATRVHQLLKSFLQTETAKQWIKPVARRQNGHEHMIALSNHLSGKGNTSRRIAQAEGYRDSLYYYKHEKSLSFSNFLDKIQKMLL